MSSWPSRLTPCAVLPPSSSWRTRWPTTEPPCAARVSARLLAAPLREALTLAQHCGAEPLAETAREELIVSGARPRRETLAGPEALTPSERRVAELAASGLQNREIAQALFVTTKTVGTHLAHIYQKLDLSGQQAREQLGELLETQGISA